MLPPGLWLTPIPATGLSRRRSPVRVETVCGDQAANSQPKISGPGVSRRQFMYGTAAAAAAAALSPRLPPRSAARAAAADGTSRTRWRCTCIPRSASRAARWTATSFRRPRIRSMCCGGPTTTTAWTDRLAGRCTSPASPPRAAGWASGGPWTWRRTESGPLASGSGGGIVTNPCSPNDPVAGGSMHLTAKSTTTATAKFGYYANCHPAGWNYRGNLTGQSLTIDVLLDQRLDPRLSGAADRHLLPRGGGRPARRRLYACPTGSCRRGRRRGRVAHGLQGVITIPVDPGQPAEPGARSTITPASDIAALWPDLDYRDFALSGLTLSAASTGDRVGGYFDYLRFTRKISGEAFLRQQKDMVPVLAPKYPGVGQRQGLEVSWLLPHINWFGGAWPSPTTADHAQQLHRRTCATPWSRRSTRPAGWSATTTRTATATRPAAPGRRSRTRCSPRSPRNCCPPGRRGPRWAPTCSRSATSCARAVDLAHHVALWDVMSRNAVFLTGNGTNDDHFGQNWHGIGNNWFTSAWAASTAERTCSPRWPPGGPGAVRCPATGAAWTCWSTARARWAR